MPQMSPINWLYLMFFFNVLLMMTVVFIYYLYKSMISNKSDSLVINKYLNWKW